MATGVSPSEGSILHGVTDNQKRWLFFGIALSKVLVPEIRSFVEQGIQREYSNLQTSHSIHTQSTSGRLKNWPSFLKYENINGNDALPKLPSGRFLLSLFDCRVTSHVDFARLYVENHMAKFTAFDEHCDASAVLTLLGKVPVFSPAVQSASSDVRQARNAWALCVFSDWDPVNYQQSFNKMETLVKALGLQPANERNLLGELKDWESKGTVLCTNATVDRDLLKLVQQHVHTLKRNVDQMTFEVQEDRERVSQALNDISTRQEKLEARVARLKLEVLNQEQSSRQKKMDALETSIRMQLKSVKEKLNSAFENQDGSNMQQGTTGKRKASVLLTDFLKRKRTKVFHHKGDSSPGPVSEGDTETETGSRVECAQTKSESEMKVVVSRDTVETNSEAHSENWIESTLRTGTEKCVVGKSGTVWRLQDTLAACITFPPNAVKATVVFRCIPWQSRFDLPPLRQHEALVSNLIALDSDDLLGSDFIGNFDEEVSVALSHSAADLKGYEVVMRELVDSDNNEWKDLETTNIWKVSDTQCDPCSTPRIPFCEAKVTRCSVFAVICRLKSYTYSTHGRRKRDFTCRVPEYPDVSVTIPASVIQKNGDFQLTLKVQEIPQQWFDESEIICPVLHIACSPAIQLVEPAIITIPTSLQENKNDRGKLSFKNAHVRLLMNSDEETSHWTEITEQLSRPARLTKGVITFQAAHFTRFFVWVWLKEMWNKNPKDSADHLPKNVHLEDRADRLTQHFPLNAGFFACLCRSGNIAGKSMLRHCCYPIALEEQVKKSICAAFDVFSYGYGNSLEPLCPDDVIHLELRKGLKPTDDEDALKDRLRLRFLRDWKFENDIVVRVSSEHVPTVEFFRYLDAKPPRRRRFRDEKPPRRRRKEKQSLRVLSMAPPSTGTESKHLVTVKAGNPSDDELEWLSTQLGDNWEQLGRRLDFSDAELIAFRTENDRMAERARRMLVNWKQTKGSEATYQVLYDALTHKFVSCKLLAETLCCN